MNEKEKATKCPNCLKLVSESETDNCEECDKIFCKECLIYYGENSEMAFCAKYEADQK